MALQYQSRPEPMNATPHHSKVKVSVTLSDSFFIAGDAVTGKMELESRADKGLGLGIIMVELVAIEGRHLLALSHDGAPLLARSSQNLLLETMPQPLHSYTSIVSFKVLVYLLQMLSFPIQSPESPLYQRITTAPGADLRPSSFVSLSHRPPLRLSISETVSPEYDTRSAPLLASPGKTRTGSSLISVPLMCCSAILAASMPPETRGVVLISTRGPHRRVLLSVKVARSGYRAVSSEACWWQARAHASSSR